MKNTNKKYWIIIALLILIIVIGAYKFIIQDGVSQSLERRTVIVLNDEGKEFILEEMTNFLVGVKNIIASVAENNMPLVAEYANKNGKIVQKLVPLEIIAKLPVAFKTLDTNTHSKFNQLALDAQTLGDTQYTLKQLSVLMQNCISCHSIYRIKDIKH